MLNLYELVLLLANKLAFGGETERSFMLNLFELVLFIAPDPISPLEERFW